MKKSNVPTTESRFQAAIVPVKDGEYSAAVAAKYCNDIHRANILELFEDVELLIAPDKAAAFQDLKKQYTT